MKIISLRLNPYGPFEDMRLNFEDNGKSSSRSSFCIVYGQNESGKTSTLRALRSLFFGIPERTPDSFKFDGTRLRISASIENTAGEMLSFQRRKGRAKTLLSENGIEISSRELEKFLSGIDESSFNMMFGFSHEDLVRGGKDIVSGKGDIGQSLFAAGTGISGLRKIFDELDGESRDIFKPRSPKSHIITYIAKYKGANDKIKQYSLVPKEWTEHNNNLKDAEAKKTDINQKITGFSSKLGRFERINIALPTIAERKETILNIERLGDIRILGKQFTDERKNASQSLEIAAREETANNLKLQSVKDAILNIKIPENLLARRKEIEDINVRLGSYIKELKDLPALESQYSNMQYESERLFNELKKFRPDISYEEVPELSAAMEQRDNISQLSNALNTLKNKISEFDELIDSLEHKKSAAEAKLNGTGEYFDLTRLKTLIENIRKDGDIEKFLEEKTANFIKKETSCKNELSKLSLWNGTIKEIETLPVPFAETIDKFDRNFEKADLETDKIKSKINELLEETENIKRNIAALEIKGLIYTEADLEDERSKRNRGWRLIKDIYIEKKIKETEIHAYAPDCNDNGDNDGGLSLVDIYEKNIENTDKISDSLRRESEAVSKKTIWLSRLDSIANELQSLEIQKKEYTTMKEKLTEEWNGLWSPLKFTPLTPKEMRSWLQNQQRLAKDAENLRYLKEDIDNIKKQIAKNHSSLFEHLQSAGYMAEAENKSEEKQAQSSPHLPQAPKYLPQSAKPVQVIGLSQTQSMTLSEMINEGLYLIKRQDEIKAEKSELDRDIKRFDEELDSAKIKKEKTISKINDLKEKWKKEMSAVGLKSDEEYSAVKQFVDIEQELTVKISESKTLMSRITSIKKNIEDFELEADSLCAAAKPEVSNLEVKDKIYAMQSALSRAIEDKAVLQKLNDDLYKYEEENNTIKNKLEVLNAKLKSMMKEANCENIEQLKDVERKSQEAELLKNKLEQLNKELSGHSGGIEIEKFIAASEEINPDSIPGEIANTKLELEKLKKENSELEQSIGAEKQYLKQYDGNSDAAAEAAENKEEAAAQIEHYADRYIKIRLASIILKNEIERYRLQNQGPVLEKASRIFSTLTLKSFSGLRTSYTEKDEAILVGLRNGAGEEIREVEVGGMSEGTCDQLYLSLRLASFEKYIESNEPMPMIIDDALVNFDDERAFECLKIFSEISKKTQIIYFTHHRHILDLLSKGNFNELILNL